MVVLNSFVVGVIQIDTQEDKRKNLEKLARFIDEAVSKGARMVAMPENVNFIGPKSAVFENAETIPGPTTELFAGKARAHGIWIHCGSIGERIPGEERLYNTSVVIDPKGNIAAKYEKIHLFDVDLVDGPSTRESDTKKAGKNIVTFETPYCTMGLSICYDIRFPELYRIMTLRGARVLFAPANFTMFTGKDHWESLLRARAIENQCYVVAPAQIGVKPSFQSYGRSLVVNPWGTVIATADDREGVFCAEIDLEYLESIRRQLPCLPNRQPEAYR